MWRVLLRVWAARSLAPRVVGGFGKSRLIVLASRRRPVIALSSRLSRFSPPGDREGHVHDGCKDQGWRCRRNVRRRQFSPVPVRLRPPGAVVRARPYLDARPFGGHVAACQPDVVCGAARRRLRAPTVTGPRLAAPACEQRSHQCPQYDRVALSVQALAQRNLEGWSLGGDRGARAALRVRHCRGGSDVCQRRNRTRRDASQAERPPRRRHVDRVGDQGRGGRRPRGES